MEEQPRASQQKMSAALPNTAILNTYGNNFETVRFCEYIILI